MSSMQLGALRSPGRSGPRPNVPRPHASPRADRPRSGQTTRRRARRWGKAVIWTMLLGAMSIGGILGYRQVEPQLHAWLEIRDISIYGGRQVTRKEVLDRLALRSGASLISIEPEELVSRLRLHPWIKDASVTRRIPHRLDIQVVERRPAAVLYTRSQPLLLDEEGHVLAIASDGTAPGLPVLLGLDANAVVQGNADARRAAQASVRLASVLTAPDATLAGRTLVGRLEVDAANPENLVAQVHNVRIQFGAAQFEEKWDRYRQVEPDLRAVGRRAAEGPSVQGGMQPRNRERDQSGREIDLRYPGKVIVRERG